MQGIRALIAVVACLAGSGVALAAETRDVESLDSGKALTAVLPFSEAVRAGNTLYLSGQIGVLPGTLTLAPGGIRGQARQAMENIKTLLEAHGYSIANIVKCTVMLADMADWAVFNEVYRGYFGAHYPARSAFGASGLALGGRLEIDCIAVIDP